MNTQRLERLLDLYFDEGLCAETKQELEETLLSSPQARELFWQCASLNSLLRQHGQETWGGEESAVEKLTFEPLKAAKVPLLVSLMNSPLMRLATAAVVLIAFAGLWTYTSIESESVKPIVAQQSDDGQSEGTAWVAVLRKAVAVEWLDPSTALSTGEPMAAGRIRLESGLIEIQTNRGALIAIQGPADLEIVSDMEVNCRSGRLRVDVPPPAHGFLVRTSSVNVVDRGTSFAMNVSDDQDAQVHVIEGLVELVSPTDAVPMRELREGESVSVANEGVYRDISATSEMFPSAAMVNSQTLMAGARKFRAWKRRRDVIIQDPSCSLYFDFQLPMEGYDTVLSNRAIASKSGSDIDGGKTDIDLAAYGTIVGCDWTSGRWPGKHALEFKNVFDRVLFSVPGDYQSLTCIASVRIDAMDSPLSALLTSDGEDANELKWQLARSQKDRSIGRLRLGYHGHPGQNSKEVFFSEPVFRSEQRGTWIQLAFVWDGNNGTCSQYVDGKLVSQDGLRSQDSILKNGKFELGNWTAKKKRFQSLVQNFNGRMDEFIMFNRALGSNEILAYQDLEKVFWNNKTGNNNWGNTENWVERIAPRRGDRVCVDLDEPAKAVFSEGSSRSLGSIYVGSGAGKVGELEITGGTLKAEFSSDRHTRVGVQGGIGRVRQTSGQVILNSLQVGLDPESFGDYVLSGGKLLVARGVNASIGSLDIGPKHGVGAFKILGGSLLTRRGVTIGRDGGLGTFSVEGTEATQIDVGKYKDGDGFWMQHPGSTLRVKIDDQGVTPISIAKFADGIVGENIIVGGSVTFGDGALLDVSFLSDHRSGSWDIMKWDGVLTDHGLRLDKRVDANVWSFEFVDTDESGRHDTLRVNAGVLDERTTDLVESEAL